MTPPESLQHNVYCALPGPIRRQVVGQSGVDVLRRARAPHRGLAEVTDVEEADGVAGRGVLGDRARVGHRHRPAAEFSETGAEFAVAVLQRAMQQVVTHVEHINPPVRFVLPAES